MSPGLGGVSRSWEGEPQGPASTPGVEPVSPVSCGLRSRGAGDEPLTVAPGAEPQRDSPGARQAGRPGTALHALAPRELPRVLPGQPRAQWASGSQGLGLQGQPAPCTTDP